jgi:Uma2 family endonuclease
MADHLLSVDEWDALPQDNSRHYELVKGKLFATPRAASLHQRAMTRLAYLLDEQLPDELTALADTDVVLFREFPPTVRAPDVLVIPTSLAERNPPRYCSEDAVLAVEIISPGSKRTDLHVKFDEYADAGIPYYWIIDLDQPVTLSAHLLVDGHYEVLADNTGTVELLSPAPLTVDLNSLISRRP